MLVVPRTDFRRLARKVHPQGRDKRDPTNTSVAFGRINYVFKKLTIPMLAVLFAACAAPSGESRSQASDKSFTGQAAVTVKGIAFGPMVIDAQAGESITWTNEDDVLHTVTSGLPQKQGVPGVSDGKRSRPDGVFDGELDGAGSTFETTIDEPGTYPYFCEVHSGMQGELRVTSPK